MNPRVALRRKGHRACTGQGNRIPASGKGGTVWRTTSIPLRREQAVGASRQTTIPPLILSRSWLNPPGQVPT